MDLRETLAGLRPTSSTPVRELVHEAGVDVSGWEESKSGQAIGNPNANTYRNSQWCFGGNGEPIVACIWHRNLEIDGDFIVCPGSAKEEVADMGSKLASAERTASEAQRLRNKIIKAQVFDRTMSEAYRKMLPVRAILLEGEAKELADAAVSSSHASKRLLDGATWYVHAYDPYSGNYRLVRGLPPPARPAPDPFGDAVDPADDPAFQAILNSDSLEDTVKDAMVKARVGQGWFRDSLIRRWGGCAATGCKDPAMLIASHIVPWRICTTRAERLGVANGLLLSPNLDKAFDAGLISFDDSFQILISHRLGPVDASQLGIVPGTRLKRREFDDIRPFLERHRNEVFQGPARGR